MNRVLLLTVGYRAIGGPSFVCTAVFWDPGRSLTVEEFCMPWPKAGEALIRTRGHTDPFRCNCLWGFVDMMSYVLNLCRLRSLSYRSPFSERVKILQLILIVYGSTPSTCWNSFSLPIL